MIHIKRLYWRLNAIIAIMLFIVIHVLNYLFGNRHEPIINNEVKSAIKNSWYKY